MATALDFEKPILEIQEKMVDFGYCGAVQNEFGIWYGFK